MSQFCQCQRLDATCLLKVTFTSHPSPSSPNTDHSAGTTRVACRPTQWGCLCGNNMDWFLEWSEFSRFCRNIIKSLFAVATSPIPCLGICVSTHTHARPWPCDWWALPNPKLLTTSTRILWPIHPLFAQQEMHGNGWEIYANLPWAK